MISRSPSLEPEDFDITDIPANDERSMARRICLQIQYEADTGHHYAPAIMARQLDERQPTGRIRRYVQQLVEGITRFQTDIDAVIGRLAPEFPVDQIAVIDRNILRIAIFEFAVDGRTPVGVAIDEAVELAKIFGGEGAPAFVNGVLGSLADHPELTDMLRALAPADELPEEP